METRISEIADGIFRLSTFVPDVAPPAGFTFNQFLVLGDEPLMFHTGLRKMFPLNRDALRLRDRQQRAKLRHQGIDRFERNHVVQGWPSGVGGCQEGGFLFCAARPRPMRAR